MENNSFTIDETFSLAIKYHQKGNLEDAEKLYLKIPKLLNKNEGSIKFSLIGYDYPYEKNLSNFTHSPKNFDLTLFPSSLFHETIPFNSQDERHCIAFDLIPV